MSRSIIHFTSHVNYLAIVINYNRPYVIHVAWLTVLSVISYCVYVSGIVNKKRLLLLTIVAVSVNYSIL